MRYVEDENGQMVDGHRASAIRKLARSIWVALANAGKAPAKWSQADVVVAQSYKREMRRHFPELQLCENDWKADLIASDNYPSWYSHQANTSKRSIKQERDDSDDDADVSHPSSTAKQLHKSGKTADRAAKKVRLESKQPAADGNLQPTGTSSLTEDTSQPLKVYITYSHFLLADHATVFTLIILDKEPLVSLYFVQLIHVNHSSQEPNTYTSKCTYGDTSLRSPPTRAA